MSDYFIAILLGIIEGLTEFLPISSTGHLILAEQLIGAAFPSTFETMIQLGAVLAVVVLYFDKLWSVIISLPQNPASRRFTLAVVLAFFPSMGLGALLHDFIKSVLFSPLVVSITLVVGGFLILLTEKLRPKPHVLVVDDISISLGLKIGLCQCLALVPGMSRSGATIIGAMLMGVERKAAAEFSFFLSIPTMLGVFAFEGWHNRQQLLAQGGQDLLLIAIGFVVALITAIFVIKLFIGIVGRVGFAPFAYYRIALGLVMLGIFWPG
ncbi:undecaprenyl-diphosphate phosphatase [Candidatus Phycosocius spiralis]|uniref:Undecaprenyl-diphosphatase n=1 Tax=Candidatus Phycosocius spiralis TaxID=2815099 RepID=A0ABQ4PU18_9PROT|nr:undecaprenyl-diphosphate phosphatase [Candidatus Phycosocius spiralis]GIU66512.1 undecaprenyl-diphosphatase 1 [Candidatus Phycosocius spiralis]